MSQFIHDLAKELLGPFTPVKFVSSLFFAYALAFIMLLISALGRDPLSSRTPFHFSWGFLITDNFLKIIIAFLLIPLTVRFVVLIVPDQWKDFIGAGVGLVSGGLAHYATELSKKLLKWGNSKTNTE